MAASSSTRSASTCACSSSSSARVVRAEARQRAQTELEGAPQRSHAGGQQVVQASSALQGHG